jgi:8-oxo-(d)GTP phosphatase
VEVDLTGSQNIDGGAEIQAAGGVLWRVDDTGTLVIALVHRPRYDDWSLPKGKLDPGEHPTVAAVREIAEETGQAAVLGRPLPSAHYLVEGVPKTVHYWAARALGGEFRANDEVDELAWLDPAEAAPRLARESDAAVLAAFLTAPVDTGAVILLRHGHAKSRRDWGGKDVDRPLRHVGLEQGRRLVPILRAFGIGRVMCSPALRCLQTVRPFGHSIGTEPEILSGLAEEVGGEAFGRAAREVVAAARDASVVVCSHRPVLPPLGDALAEAGLAEAGGEALAPGEFEVAHHRNAALIALERHRS